MKKREGITPRHFKLTVPDIKGNAYKERRRWTKWRKKAMLVECDRCGSEVKPVKSGFDKCCPECGSVIVND
jgi:predicted RNA-binding Zn-ribbon protein involved in translation (DUF1610 family)